MKSGELARLRAEAEEAADRLRAEKKREQIKAQPRRPDGTVDKPSGAPTDAPLGKTESMTKRRPDRA